MFRQCWFFLLVFVAVSSGNAAHGQSTNSRTTPVTVMVPFEFQAGDRTMPAGRYAFQKDDDWNLVLICRAGTDCTPVQVRSARTRGEVKKGLSVLVLKGASRRLALVQISADEAYVFPGFPKDVLRTADKNMMYERIQDQETGR